MMDCLILGKIFLVLYDLPKLGVLLELVSKELNHLAAILYYYAGSFIWYFVSQSQLETDNLKLLHFMFMVNCSVFETLKLHHHSS